MNAPYSLTVDGFESQFGVNHLGHFLLTNLLLDVLKRSAPSRIVVLSSEAHRFGKVHFNKFTPEQKDYNGWVYYGQSKRANIMFTCELSRRLEGTGVTVNCGVYKKM
jgi:NAD(P)-dependent dehydrogenase (short-subunit alcohol dehydrogenase family)